MNDSMINRIAALLAKSESSGYGPESDAYLSKAQELMTRYSIDTAMLRSHDRNAYSEIVVIDVVLTKPNGRSLSRFNALLSAVALPNSCKAFSIGKTGAAKIVGFPEDAQRVLDVYLLLSLQMQTECNRRMKTKLTNEHGSTYRAAFYAGFASAIFARLTQAAAESTEQATSEYGTSMALVLTNKVGLIEQHPALSSVRTRRSSDVYSREGYLAGGRAARNANIARRSEIA